MTVRGWIEQGRRLAPTVEVDVAGVRLRVRRLLNFGWWQSVVRRAEATAAAVPFSIPEEARGFLPEDAETAQDLARSAVILEALLAEPNAATVPELLELAAVNGPVYAELARRVLDEAARAGAELEASAIEAAKKNSDGT